MCPQQCVLVYQPGVFRIHLQFANKHMASAVLSDPIIILSEI